MCENVLMECRDLCGETSKRGRNRIELDLLDFRICVELGWILMDHVIRTKDSQRELLYAYSVLVHIHFYRRSEELEVPARIPPSSLLDGHSTDLR